MACVTGEASIQMNIQDFPPAKQFHLPIKISGDAQQPLLGWSASGRRSSTATATPSPTWTLPDFACLAEAYGHVGIRVDKPGDVEGRCAKAFQRKNDRLVFLDFQVDQTENVYPMVQGGKGPDRHDPVGRRSLMAEGGVVSFRRPPDSPAGPVPMVGCQRFAPNQTMRHVISFVIENEAGALSAFRSVFARGYNIESLTVAPTEDAFLSRMTIVTSGRTTSSSRSPSSSTSWWRS